MLHYAWRWSSVLHCSCLARQANAELHTVGALISSFLSRNTKFLPVSSLYTFQVANLAQQLSRLMQSIPSEVNITQKVWEDCRCRHHEGASLCVLSRWLFWNSS